MEENYQKILLPERQRSSSRGNLGALQESESDRARILYSSAFRRLQRKTQVFPLEENAAVRSRLTHSLEVAHVGRYLATSVVEVMRKKKRLKKFGLNSEGCLTLANLVETACLAHDIGNPPFGHFGESAIAAWAGRLAKKKWPRAQPGKSAIRDFEFFDGNPQGLRIITNLSGTDNFGMNLTAAQIASTVKYPCISTQIDSENPILKKAGVFESENETWEWVKESINLGENQRFPIAFLMEAADDISYCLSDIEDGIEKRYTNHEDFYKEVKKQLEIINGNNLVLEKVLKEAKKNSNDVDPTVFARAKLVRELVREASTAYVDRHAEIFSGKVNALFDDNSPYYQLLKAIKEAVKVKLYNHRKSIELELTGCAAISGILAKYEPLIELDHDDFASLAGRRVKPSLVEAQRLYFILAPKYLKSYHRNCKFNTSKKNTVYSRSQLIVDFVSGMTDVYALQTYQLVNGIRSG